MVDFEDGCAVEMSGHRLRTARNDPSIHEVHLADAIEQLIGRNRPSLSEDRTAKNPYPKS
jgi:hypothetical protein